MLLSPIPCSHRSLTSQDYFQRLRSQIAKVTIDDIQQTANRYLNPAHAAILISGEAKQIIPQVEPYGNLQIMNSDFQPIQHSNT